MAARFYNQIWKDGDAALRVDKNSDVSKLFCRSVGVSPTVASLDSLSNEAIREAAKYIEAFDLMLSRDELHSASQRLMEAYAMHNTLRRSPRCHWRKNAACSTTSATCTNSTAPSQARDYTKTKELADALKKTAKDFPSSKVDSAIAAYTLASDLAIEEQEGPPAGQGKRQGRRQNQSRHRDLAHQSQAHRVPQSHQPGRRELVTIRNDFDRLLGEGNFREIARAQFSMHRPSKAMPPARMPSNKSSPT